MKKIFLVVFIALVMVLTACDYYSGALLSNSELNISIQINDNDAEISDIVDLRFYSGQISYAKYDNETWNIINEFTLSKGQEVKTKIENAKSEYNYGYLKVNIFEEVITIVEIDDEPLSVNEIYDSQYYSGHIYWKEDENSSQIIKYEYSIPNDGSIIKGDLLEVQNSHNYGIIDVILNSHYLNTSIEIDGTPAVINDIDPNAFYTGSISWKETEASTPDLLYEYTEIEKGSIIIDDINYEHGNYNYGILEVIIYKENTPAFIMIDGIFESVIPEGSYYSGFILWKLNDTDTGTYWVEYNIPELGSNIQTDIDNAINNYQNGYLEVSLYTETLTTTVIIDNVSSMIEDIADDSYYSGEIKWYEISASTGDFLIGYSEVTPETGMNIKTDITNYQNSYEYGILEIMLYNEDITIMVTIDGSTVDITDINDGSYYSGTIEYEEYPGATLQSIDTYIEPQSGSVVVNDITTAETTYQYGAIYVDLATEVLTTEYSGNASSYSDIISANYYTGSIKWEAYPGATLVTVHNYGSPTQGSTIKSDITSAQSTYQYGKLLVSIYNM